MSDAPDQPEETLLAIVRRFRQTMLEATPFARDREGLADLLPEVRPVLEAMLASFSADDRLALDAAEHGETFALITLLGRRAATLGLSPTAASSLTRALLGGMREEGVAIPHPADPALAALALEGYVAGREDVLIAQGRAAQAKSLRPVELVPRVVLLRLAGDVDSEALAEVIDELGRVLLRADAVAVVVALDALVGANEARAAEVFAAAASARLLGARAWFVAAEPWVALASHSRSELTFAPTVEDALLEALPLAGHALRPTSWLPAPFRALLGRKG